ncbi:MAG: DEAD/DEAH box helicase [Balneolaceae bacterium]|nr:DEAD/DEAH box helicase [Balneolaceae bacterium]
MTFNDFDLHNELQSGLRDIGYKEPTPIQEESIPAILNQKDVIGAAQTGTGKTGAFVIPIIEQILKDPSEHTQALILSPTRELAQQIDEQIFALGYHTGISSANVIGGADFSKQAQAIRAGVDIIVATPGRLIDQTKVLDIDFSHIKYLVLDEADRMLDMGFLPDVTKIIDKLPKERQTLLFSATMPAQIKNLAKKIMKQPVKIEFEVSTPAESVEQHAYQLHPNKKVDLVVHLLETLEWESCIIFSATKRGTDKLERTLNKRGINAGSIHGDRDQDERNKALNAFKNKTTPVIVATDVLARGIDIANVSVIINFDVPRAVDDYIHRIGRTGRYDKSGIAITLVSRNDGKYFHDIRAKVKDQLKEKDLPDALKRGDSKKKSSRRKHTSSKPKSKKKHQNTETDKQQSKDTSASSSQKPRRRRKPASPQSKGQKKQEKKAKRDSAKKPKPDQKKKARENKRKEPVSSQSKEQSSAGNVIPAERIKKATKRNQNSPKPAKGIWGLVKSFLPKIGK